MLLLKGFYFHTLKSCNIRGSMAAQTQCKIECGDLQVHLGPHNNIFEYISPDLINYKLFLYYWMTNFSVTFYTSFFGINII